jgi:hypothetical protein
MTFRLISIRGILAAGALAFGSLALYPEQVNAAPIYVYKEPGGSIRFTSKPPPEGVKAQVFTAKGAAYSVLGGGRRGGKLFTQLHATLIEAAAREHRIESSLVRAVIHAESAFNARAVSPKGARGLMQLMPEVAKELGVTNSFDPAQNIAGGTRHLALLIRKYDGNLRLALAAYNAGAGAVEQYGGIPPYRETQEYVRKVLSLQSRYAVHRVK